MQQKEMQGLLGRLVKDLYGRHVGTAVGFNLKSNGEIDSVAVDGGNGVLTELTGSMVLPYEDGLVLAPTWKVDTGSISGQTELLRRRIAALDELKEDGSLSPEDYSEARDRYTAQLTEVRRSGEALVLELRSRLDALDRQDETLKKFLVNVKVQFRSGELGEDAFRSMEEAFNGMRSRNAKEREEITAVIRVLGHDEAGQAQLAVVQR